MASVALFILAVLVVLCKLIDGVISQVHEIVVYVVPVGSLVGLRAEASESHLV